MTQLETPPFTTPAGAMPAPPKPLSIGQYLIKRLQDYGVRDVFGIPGDYVLTFYGQLEKSPINVVGCTREDCAGFAADAYARINGMAERLQLALGGPERVTGTWPLVLANVLAAPLIEMAPALVRRVGHHGQLILSGIPASVEQDVDDAYLRLGMRRVRVASHGGWVALVLTASW